MLNRFSLVFIILISFQEVCISQQLTGAQKKAPNIIFILTDDQRFDALGYAGNDLIHTPEMDNLAKQGTYFKNALVTTPICAASRASIFTGLYERTHRYNFQTGNIRGAYMEASYPTILKNNGYQTGFFGKYGVRYDELDEQFDVFESYDRNNAYDDRRGYYYKTIGQDTVHLTRYTGHKALEYIEDVDPSKPFALSLSFSAPHAHDSAEDQYFWQDESDKLLQDITMPGPELGADKYFEAQPKFVREGFNRTRWYWRFDTPEKYQHSVKGYYRMISGVDREISKIREKLREKGLAENTVIILMGDNGYFLGERQLAGKWLLYDNSIRVPLVIFDPRLKEQKKNSNEMATNVDIPSTILDLAGIEQPGGWQGKSLMPLIKGQASSLERDTVLIEHLWEFEHIPPSEGLRTKNWKYFRYINNKSVEELYNLDKDPQEINNLADDPDYAQVLNDLRNKTDELLEEKSDSYSKGPKDLTVEFLRKPSDSEVSIRDNKPEYSWIVPEGAVYQSAYQVLVASSRQNIDDNIGDVWDSGQVRSSNSTEITHHGGALMDGETYYWKVRIWDKDNRLTEYSDSQSFTTADSKHSTITTPNSFQIDRIKPEVFEERKDSYFIDFGKDAFATLNFAYEAETDHTLTFRIGEQLKGEKINRDPQGHIRYQQIEVPVKKGKTTYQLPVKADERNTSSRAVALPDSFPVLMPFRYAEVEGARQPLSAEDFTQLAFHSYWEEAASSFKSSNDILNQVWELCKYSIKATTFAGLYVDGDRERIPYEADAYLNQLSHYTTDREYTNARQTIEYFMDNPTWPTEWQLHVALMFYADYMYTGNTELIEKYYEDLKHKTLFELSREDGLISSENATPAFMKKLGFEDPDAELRDITDWPPAGWQGNPKVTGERDGFVFKPYNTVVNSFYYKNMKIMAEFARELGKYDEATEFEFRAIKVKKAINEKLFNEETGAFIDGEGTDHSSLHANMMPLAFGIVPENHQQSVVDFIKSRGMAASVYGAQYLMEALYRAGADEYALELLTSKADRSWYNMIRVGSTITMEAWDMKYKPNADWNHAWGAVPANIIPRELWGIKPAVPGYSMAHIEPQMGGLNKSSIEVPTMRGTIKGEYRYVNPRRQSYTIEIPANMVAEFKVETGNGKVLMLNGEKTAPGFDTLRLTPGVHQIELVVNSF